MPAPIVVDVGAPEPQRELSQALIEACTEAAASINTECRLVRDAPSGPYAAIAIVTWEDGGRARVEVGIRREPVSEWRMRELTFQAADADIERYRSVGFVIGSLTTAAREEESQPDPPPPKPEPEPPPPPPLPAPTPAPKPAEPRQQQAASFKRGWVGIHGMLGGGLDRGPARYGAAVAVGVRVVSHLGVVVSGGASTRQRDDKGMKPEWLEAGLGLGVSLGPLQAFHVDARLQVLAEQFTANVRIGSASDERSRTSAGWRVALDGVLPLGEIVELVAGAEGTLRPATRVHVRGNADGSTRNFELGATAGFRVEL